MRSRGTSRLGWLRAERRAAPHKAENGKGPRQGRPAPRAAALPLGGRGAAEVRHYPATGNRANNTGTMSTFGRFGFYWSSTVNGVNPYTVYFTTAQLNPSYALSRANGYQVRCLRE